jgi:uncharacterized protein YecE (DUF72 family)
MTLCKAFIYIHLPGLAKIHASEYSEDKLLRWAEKIKKWNKDTYVYFYNFVISIFPAFVIIKFYSNSHASV